MCVCVWVCTWHVRVCACVCEVHVYIWRDVLHVHIGRGHGWISDVSLSLFLSHWTWSWLTTGQQAPGSLLSPHPSPGITGAHHHPELFLRVLGIWRQVATLSQKTPYSLSHLPGIPISFLLKWPIWVATLGGPLPPGFGVHNCQLPRTLEKETSTKTFQHFHSRVARGHCG